jgi:fluoroquinolone transport system permease protein
VLDEVDASTLTALRVTPVPLSTFFAYRAATVMVVTTLYVVATMSFSGILAPGLVPALIPIGLLAGLSAVVTLLLLSRWRATRFRAWPWSAPLAC